MNNKTLSAMKCILYLLAFLAMGSAELYAGEPEGKIAVPTISNVGFMENPPKELKEKFPMCDAFLKVEWIDKEKKIGYSRYDFYKDGKKVGGVTSALVHLDDDHPTYDYNLEWFRKKGKLKEIFALIRRGEVNFEDSDLQIVEERTSGRYVQEFSHIDVDWGMTSWLSLAEYKMNVCIPYPDNQRMFFAENKKVNKIYDENEIASKSDELKQWVPDVPFFEAYTVMDINFDGKEDYLAGDAIIYSSGNRYYEMKIETPGLTGSPNTKLISPTTKRTCEFSHLSRDGYYYTTDGTNIYIDNQCNLTELTKEGK